MLLMAVKIGKIPPREPKNKNGSGAAFAAWIDDDGQFGNLLNENGERRRKMEFTYTRVDPNWQDHQLGRDREFSELFDALKGDGLFSKDNKRERKRVYFPAANRQLETRVFADHCDDVLFVGGDMVRSAVAEGKTRTKSQNADFVVADGFRVPFEDESLDAIIDIAGASWYALEPHSPGESSRDNFKSLLHEWHKALGPSGVVVLDDYFGNDSRYLTTMDWFREACPDIFENVKKGGFYFTVDDYRVAFKARTVKVGSSRALPRQLGGRAYIFEKL